MIHAPKTLTKTLLVCILIPSAVASFTHFADCISKCRGSYWRQVAWNLDCELAAAACVVTLGGNLSFYSPTPHAGSLMVLPPDPLDPNVPRCDLMHSAGSLIPFELDVMQITPNYQPGPSLNVNDAASFDAFRQNHLYQLPTQIDFIGVRALPFLGPQMLPDDMGEALLEPQWQNAPVLFEGPPQPNMVLDTTGLDAGVYILRTEVHDQLLPHNQFGMIAFELIEPQDPFECNSSCGAAVPLPLGPIDGLRVCDNDEDFFVLTLNDGDTLNASIFFDHGLGDLDLYLTETLAPGCGGTAPGQFLTRGFSASDDEFITWTNLSGGPLSYTVWVDWWDGQVPAIGCNAFDMFISIQPPGGIGAYICDAVPNSTGQGAHISAQGSNVVVDNDVTLHCEQLPPSSFGLFVMSQDTIFVANPGGSTGNLCIGSTLMGRQPPVLSSGALGAVSLPLDLNAINMPTGIVVVQIFDTWYAQFWFRDSDGMGGATSNLSDAICLFFE